MKHFNKQVRGKRLDDTPRSRWASNIRLDLLKERKRVWNGLNRIRAIIASFVRTKKRIVGFYTS